MKKKIKTFLYIAAVMILLPVVVTMLFHQEDFQNKKKTGEALFEGATDKDFSEKEVNEDIEGELVAILAREIAISSNKEAIKAQAVIARTNLVAAKLGASVATMFFASIVSKARALMPEEIFADDASLTNTAPVINQLSAAKKVQTCNLMLDYLKENIEFIMLSKEQFAIIKQQLSKLVQMLDASTRLLFAQNLTAAMTDDGNSLIEMLFDVFEKDLIDMLELSDATRKAIEGAK